MAALQANKSSALVHIYSTLANGQTFTTYKPGGADLQVIDREVPIKGGAGIASKNLITPMGVHTAIGVDDYEAIKDLKHFKDFVDNGLIRVERKKASELERIVGDMNPRDPGGPVTPADYAQTPSDGSVPIPVESSKLGTGWVLK
jgi:hypothetical protein